MTTIRIKCIHALLYCFVFTAYTQQVTLASGTTCISSGGELSYSIGQIICSTHSSSNGSIEQGIQQSYSISPITESIEARSSLSLHIFPNPTAKDLILQIDNFNNEDLTYQLSDIQGIAIDADKINGHQTHLTISHLRTATYFLYIIENRKKIHAFKITKTN
jgi:hypothetical protein